MLQESHRYDGLHHYHGISSNMRQGLRVYIGGLRYPLLHPPLLMMLMLTDNCMLHF